MAEIKIEFDEDELEALAAAAETAERSVEDFIAEEILSLADQINLHGNLKHVTLARHRDAEATEFFDNFNSSGRAAGPIEQWARKQSAT